MKTLGKRQYEEDTTTQEDNFTIPAVVRNDNKEISIEKAIAISAIAHPVVAGFLWGFFKLLILLLAILGITFPLFNKPEPKIRDIEFVLVNKPEQTPINPNTRNRADKNSRAGGKHDPKKAIVEPEPMSAPSRPQKSSAPPAPSLQKVFKSLRQQRPSKPTQAQQPDTPVPPRPMPAREIPRPNAAKPNAFSIPVPPSKKPKAMTPGGGPVTSGPIGGDSSPSSSPAPIMGGGSGSRTAGGKGRYNSGYSLGGGSAGNPSPGNPNGSPGIDAIREPDFGPYMRELQRRIKRNWDPPRGNESKRVILLFKVSRDGRLLSLRLKQSSGNPETDRAAQSAVQLTAPFRPLPPEYRGSDIDIEFTFDYNVLGISGGRR